MKSIMLMVIIVFGAMVGGCNQTVEKTVDRPAINAGLLDSYNDIAIQNAIIAQHTLFPYHFVPNAAKLNSLGQKDLAILAKHFCENPGKLNVSQGDIESELYQERLNTVRTELTQAGVDTSRIALADGMPGGDALASEQILLILETEKPK